MHPLLRFICYTGAIKALLPTHGPADFFEFAIAAAAATFFLFLEVHRAQSTSPKGTTLRDTP